MDPKVWIHGMKADPSKVSMDQIWKVSDEWLLRYGLKQNLKVAWRER